MIGLYMDVPGRKRSDDSVHNEKHADRSKLCSDLSSAAATTCFCFSDIGIVVGDMFSRWLLCTQCL